MPVDVRVRHDRLRARQGLQVCIWHENSFVRAGIALLHNPRVYSNNSTKRTRRREATRTRRSFTQIATDTTADHFRAQSFRTRLYWVAERESPLD